MIETNGLRKRVFVAKAGDALIWTANLLHGGEPILRAGATRWSQVTHYYFDGCSYYTPMHSDVMAGQIAHRKPHNIASYQPKQKLSKHDSKTSSQKAARLHSITFAMTGGLQQLGKLFRFKNKTASTWIEVELPHDFDASSYAFLNPDIIDAGFDPAQHYARHVYIELRPYKIEIPADFNDEIYLTLNPDVAQSGLDAKFHYSIHGYRENRPIRH